MAGNEQRFAVYNLGFLGFFFLSKKVLLGLCGFVLSFYWMGFPRIFFLGFLPIL